MKRTTITAAVAGIAIGSIVGVAVMRLPAGHRRRYGFTLVELLMVLATISILAAILVPSIASLVGIAKNSATRTTMTKIDGLLKSRNEAFERRWGGNDAHTLARIHNTQEWHHAATFTQADGSPVNQNQRLILARKLLYARNNPETRVDLQGQPWNLPAARVANMDNSEILYYMLMLSPDAETIGHDAFIASEVADIDDDNNPEFVDAWRNPIHWWRWPTLVYHAQIDASGTPVEPHQVYTSAIIRPIPASDLTRDPHDPLRLMLSVRGFADAFHQPATALRPLVMSAGPDGAFGIDDSGDIATQWSASLTDSDNVSRRRDQIDDNITAD